MEIWFLAAAAVLLVAAIVHSEIAQAKRVDALELFCRQLKGEIDIVLPTKLDTRFTNVESSRRELHTKYNELTTFNAHVGKSLETITKDFEVMHVRQRSLEKKIIEANRTVNLVFGKPIPMQLENIPHTAVTQQRKGRGKGALINI